MRYIFMAVFSLGSLAFFVPSGPCQQAVVQPAGSMVRNIQMKGFVLENKGQFARLFKPYRNRYLTSIQIDKVLRQIEEIYEQAGYQGLISIDYRLQKKTLTFTVSLIK